MFFIIISVGIFPTDIFLYAQENEKISNSYNLLNSNQLDSLDIYIKPLFKDTITANTTLKADLFLLFGKYYDKKNKEEIALKYLTKAENLLTTIKDYERLSKINLEKFYLLSLRENLDTKKEATIYLNRFYDYAKLKNDTLKLREAYMGFAVLYVNPKDYKKSLNYYNEAIKVCETLKDTFTIAKINSNKGTIISNFYHKQDSARIFYKKALKLFKILKKPDIAFSVTQNIGASYRNENNHTSAIKYFYQADKIPIVKYRLNLKRNLYALIANSYQKTNDYQNAYKYLNKYTDYKDSVDIKEQNIAISNIQTKYKTAQKEKNIIKLKADKDRQENFLISIAIIFIFSLIAGFLAYYSVKKKKNLAEKNRQLEHQKVLNLIKDQELQTLDAIVEGQEKERKRIAEDLHDNLGGKLAVLKLNFDSLIESVTIKKNKQQLAKLRYTSELLEDTYQAIRGMAHQENANTVKLSLVHSVKSLASNISKSNKILIEATNFGFDGFKNRRIERFAFKIIQELITNIIKYASAEEVSIDLTLFDDVLGIIVSDDGIGFDKNLAEKKPVGLGLKSIKERMNKLNGSFVIDSSIGHGTTIIIELPIKK